MRTAGAIQVTQILEGLERLGAKRSRLCAEVRLDPTLLDDPEHRVPWPVVPSLFLAAESHTGDSLVGLHAGAVTHARGLPAYLFMSEATVGAALERVAPIIGQGADALRWELIGRPGHAWLRIRVESSAPGVSHVKEYCVANILRFLSTTFGAAFRAREVRLPHAPRGPEAEYARILDARVRFRQAHCEIGFDEATLSMPLPTANPVVSQVLSEQIARQLDGAGGASFRARVERELIQALHASQHDSRVRVARHLGVSVRTLHRQLEREATSFRETRDRVRRELALELLLDPSLATTVVAVRLGFRDPRAFTRAFRRWTGETPASYRARVAATKPERAD
jgi:AraC-like DNA-binding protein